MKTLWRSIVSLVCLTYSSGFAAGPTYVCGAVSGTWDTVGSPYIATCDVYVPSGQSLTIRPGVVVKLGLGLSLRVRGGAALTAIGTPTDSIRFTTTQPIPAPGQWKQIADSGTATLQYCIVEYGGSGSTYAVLMSSTSAALQVRNAAIRQNYSGVSLQGVNGLLTGSSVYSQSARGVGVVQGASVKACNITGNGSNGIETGQIATVDSCNISSNNQGIFYTSSAGALTFTRCNITNNRSWGVYLLTYGSVLLRGCTISNNGTVSTSAGGVYLYFASSSASAIIESCSVSGNRLHGIELYNSSPPFMCRRNIINSNGGAGIYGPRANATIEHNTIVANGGGITNILNSNALIRNNCIAYNGGCGLQTAVSPPATVRFNSVYSNSTNYCNFSPFYGDTTIGRNRNGDGCDPFSNICVDPKFVDRTNRDYHLLFSSHMIDAGDTLSPQDPDFTIADIGALYYHQSLPLSTPTLVSPPNGAVNQPTSVTLIWRAVLGALSYRLQVDTDSGFNPPYVLDRSGIRDTTYRIESLSTSTPYYWKVSAANSRGSGSFSSHWSFTTLPPPPPPPSLVAPPNGAINRPLNDTLRWNPSNGALSYCVQVATDTMFTRRIVDQCNITTTSLQISGLSRDTTYYWHVNAMGIGGTSGWSTRWQFRTIPNPPPAPSLYSPPNGSPNVHIPVTFVWNASQGATSYRLQATRDTSSLPDVDSSGIVGTSIIIGGLRNGSRYWWNVSAMNAGGTGSPSSWWPFTTTPLRPSPPTLVSPANNDTNVTLPVTFVWYDSGRATYFRLQVSTNPTFVPPLVVNDSIGLITTYTRLGLAPSTVYYWRMYAGNAGGLSDSSAARNFKTVRPPQPPTLIRPVQGDTGVSRTPLFVWTRVAQADSYQVQVAVDPLFNTIVRDTTTADTAKRFGGQQLDVGRWYYWHVGARNTGGTNYSSPRSFRVTFTSVDELTETPKQFALMQNYPNPFNPATTIRYQLPTRASVLLKVYDLLGREVATLIDGVEEAGYKSVQWDASNVASGVYLYTLQAGNFAQTKKLVLLR